MLTLIARILVIVGGLNWGLIGLGMLFSSGSSWNVINMIFGAWPMLEGILYLLVGVGAVIMLLPRR